MTHPTKEFTPQERTRLKHLLSIVVTEGEWPDDDEELIRRLRDSLE